MVIVLHCVRCLKRHVAALHRPLVVLFQQYCANQADDGALLGKDTDHVRAPLDLLNQVFERVAIGYAGPGFPSYSP